MDSLDEPTDEVADCSSTRASWLLLAKLSKVRYWRLGVLPPISMESMKEERLDTRLCQGVSTTRVKTLTTSYVPY